MRKKIILRLSILTVFMALLYSCRNDYFPEKETPSNSSEFRLTSKTISLEETKHKIVLGGELQKVQDKLGKNGDFGNGVSVDTDHVIYIENGSNYHTYTFRIVKENTSENEPLENLVLSPLPDGSYKKLIFTYDFTLAEKQNLLNGIPVNTKGKTTIRDLDASIISSKVAGCVYEVETFWNECSEGIHNQSNVFAWGECTAEIAPSAYTIAYWKCSNGGGSDGTGTGTGEGGSTPGSGGCEAEAFENPTDPVGSPGLCGGGVPTQPNVGNNNPTDPCEKTKNMLANPVVKSKVDKLEDKSKEAGEQAFLYQKDNTPSDLIDGNEHSVDLSAFSNYKGIYHNHTPLGIKMLSVSDIIKLYKIVMTQMNSQTSHDAFVAFVAYEPCNCPPNNYLYHNYILRFNGSMPQVGSIANLSAEDINKLADYYETLEMKLKNIPSFRNGPNLTADLNAKGLEKLLFDTLTKMNINENSIILQKVEKDGTINNVNLNPDGTTYYVECP